MGFLDFHQRLTKEQFVNSFIIWARQKKSREFRLRKKEYEVQRRKRRTFIPTPSTEHQRGEMPLLMDNDGNDE